MTTRTARLFALTALTAASVMPLASHAFAQETTKSEATISVSGEGQSAVAPDMAILNFSVVKQAETAAVALTENSKALSEVLKALKAASIEDRDLQTSNFSVQPLYKHFEPKDGVYVAPEITGYQVSNGLTVRVRDLKKLGEILDTSVKLGINQGGDITFTNDKPEATVTEARKLAVADALAKAKTLTEAAGVKLGRVIQITENMQRPMPVPQGAMRASMMKEADSVPIASGENNYSVVVNVTFALDQ
ncbi:SIMPL domain-containing protein [Rhizobium sp. RM]|uniref:SIMPL domain-containing protein n=1 Tax=Rhizobium/Agrobacterium group TaxID=227290 RepID=UPI00110E4F26|nr:MULTISPECIES: SIMPL domain-containing protein [Rhizobium/Agrobacterium group]NWJ26725.1 SIMPL domain-containing protein [Rhizobium sp. RM]TMV22604.1 SIMPL domain-containing protein [Rhizobium sp. Td3]UXS02078.1 SIMPL domain-containing protein [Agrobacterium tumefaciens]